jgi:hydroxyacylglutathione hydrolase
MTHVKTFVFNPFQENTYLLFDETKECVIVDAGCYSPSEQRELVDFIEKNNLTVKLAINTHGHIDHVLGSAFVKERFKVDLYGNPEDLPLIQSAVTHGMMYGIALDEPPLLDKNLNHNDTVRFGETELKVIHTPGHSRGGICLFCEKAGFLLTGDTLFRASIGRTDLPGGDFDTLIASIKERILTLNPNTVVYPGHGEPSTVEWEQRNNPFLVG